MTQDLDNLWKLHWVSVSGQGLGIWISFMTWIRLTAIGLSVIGTLAGLSYPTRSWSWVRLHTHVVGCVCSWNFGTKFFLRRGECKTRENSNFLKNVKIVISVKI